MLISLRTRLFESRSAGCLVAIFLFCVGPYSNLAQIGHAKQVGTERPENCEGAQRIISTVHNMRPSENLIIVSRRGNGESDKTGWRRLLAVKQFLESSWNRDPKSIIIAQGETGLGLGRLDFFVLGMLADSIYVEHNRPLILYCKK